MLRQIFRVPLGQSRPAMPADQEEAMYHLFKCKLNYINFDKCHNICGKVPLYINIRPSSYPSSISLSSRFIDPSTSF